MTRKALLQQISDTLTGLYEPREARNIALMLLSELGGVTPSALLIDGERELNIEGLDEKVEALKAGRPIQYILGYGEFLGRRFHVSEDVLIPRPETEELVDWIVREEGDARSILDIGTGSGCIAVSLSLELPAAKVFATDISEAALATAARNNETLGGDVTFRRSDALKNMEEVFPEQMDVMVSNPPYVPESDLGEMHTNVRDYEPHTALFVPDTDILLFYRAIARSARRMLRPGGRLYFEIYHRAARQMLDMLREEGFTDPLLREDLYGKPRMICCRRK